MRKILWSVPILFSLLLSSYTLFEFTHGSPGCYHEGISVLPAENGGWLVSGAYNCEGNSSGWKSSLVKLDAQGDTLSIKKDLPYNGIMKATTDGSLVFAGGNHAGFAYDTAMVFKTTFSGDMLWKKKLFPAYCHHMLTDILPVADGFLVTGIYAQASCSSPVYDSYVAKLDTAGEFLWKYEVTEAGNDQLHVVRTMPDGSIAVFGWSEKKSSSDDSDYLLIKLDADGNKLFSKTYGDERDNYGYGMDVTPDNGFILNGHTSTMDVMRVDAEGKVLWSKSLAETCGGRYFKAYCSEDGGYVFLGMEKGEQCKTALIKTTAQGDIFWKKNFTGVLRTANESSNGRFVLTGYRAYLPKLYAVVFDTISIPEPVQQLDLSEHDIFARPEIEEEEDTLLSGGLFAPAEMQAPIAYPNPSASLMNIEFQNDSHVAYRLEVFDASGRLVLRDATKANRFVLTGRLTGKGMHTYRLSGEGKVFLGKILFQ